VDIIDRPVEIETPIRSVLGIRIKKKKKKKRANTLRYVQHNQRGVIVLNKYNGVSPAGGVLSRNKSI
jgi:hypothetical protein